MKVKFNESQRKACLTAIRCLSAATAALLHQDELGQPIMDRATALLHRVGPNGDNLADADLDATEVDTLARALDAAHFIYVLSKTVSTPDDERQKLLSVIRQCMSAVK